ncbi:MAG: extracellular solute-binding protein, partial [Chloroflexi bacterium]|nr:extracellular solute-binding protein [Chloroflexota bacterium]
NADGDCVRPSAETVPSGEYNPLSRPLFFYVNVGSAQEKPQVAEFVRYALGDEGIPTVLDAVGYSPTPEGILADGLADFEAALAGEMPMDDDMGDEMEEDMDDMSDVEDNTTYGSVDPSGQNIVFWYQHSGGREESLQEIIADYNESNEFGITVEGQFQGGYGEIYEKMNLILGTDEVPNLVVAYGNQAATYRLVEGSLVDINEFLASPRWGLSEEDQADFFQSFLDSDISPIDGFRLGFPPNRSMEVMYYNVEWLAELSESGAISFDGPPQTPEQFQEAACAAVENPFSAATGDTSASIGYQLSYDASRFASWTFAHGGEVFADGQYTYNSEAAVEAMTFLQGLYAEGCAGPIAERFGDQANFGQGITLFTVGSSSGIPFYQSAVAEGAQFEWSVAAIPHTTSEPVQNIYGASVSIPATTPEQELASWLFMKYYTSPEVQAKWAQDSNYFPVRASVAEGLSDYIESFPPYGAAFELLQFGTVEPQVPGYDEVRTEAETAMVRITEAQEDVVTVLDELTELSNALLADFTE